LLKTKFTAEGMKAFSNFEILMRLVVLPNVLFNFRGIFRLKISE